MNGLPILTLLTLVPLVGGVLVAGLGEQKRFARGLSLAFAFVSLALTFVLWKSFDPASGELQFVERHGWIPSLGVNYFLGVDGLGLLMVLLTAIVVPMAMLAAWNIGRADLPVGQDAQQRVPTNSNIYFPLILFLQAGLFGTFTALNFFHWFIFWS